MLAAPPKPEASKLAAMLDSYGAARALKHLVRPHRSHHVHQHRLDHVHPTARPERALQRVSESVASRRAYFRCA